VSLDTGARGQGGKGARHGGHEMGVSGIL